MKAEELLNMAEPPSTIIKLPDGLIEHLSAYNSSSIRRRVYIYDNERLLPIPGKDYELDHEKGELILPWPLKSLDVITFAIPAADERWYYVPEDGWGRL
jgi:hypothetical protein